MFHEVQSVLVTNLAEKCHRQNGTQIAPVSLENRCHQRVCASVHCRAGSTGIFHKTNCNYANLRTSNQDHVLERLIEKKKSAME